MNRLTYKLDEPVKTKYLNFEYMRIADYDIDKGNLGRITDDRIYNKLGQLEDIEEELNFDLEIVIKALLNGIYCTHSIGKRNYFSGTELSISGNREALVVYENDVYWITRNGERIKQQRTIYKRFEFKDYGKTWALSKNDLEEKDDDRS